MTQTVNNSKNSSEVQCGQRGRNGLCATGRDQSQQGQKSAAGKKHSLFIEERVLLVKLPNVPGALSGFVAKLAAEGINIGAAYQTALEGSSKAGVVLAV
jgi:hypothetical protein